MDLGCCLIAMTASFMLIRNYSTQIFLDPVFGKWLLTYLGVNAIIFFAFGLPAGIIRYTSAQDSVRILFAVMVSHTVFFLLGLVFSGTAFIEAISIPTLIISSLINFFFLITYRAIVKYFFMYIKNLRLDKSRVVIYGANEVSIAAKRTFDHDWTVNKSVVCFVDDNRKKAGKQIDGVKIFHSSLLQELIVNKKVDELIFSNTILDRKVKSRLVDLCLEKDVKVYTLPPIQQLIDGEVKTNQIKKLNIEDLLEREPIKIDLKGIANQVNGKRVLITGAAGSIGSEVVRQLSYFSPEKIILLDQAESPLHDLYLELSDVHTEMEYVPFLGDIRNRKRMEILFQTHRPHLVYHAAAYKHVPMMESNPIEAIRTNVLGSKIIADMAVEYGIEKFVMVSTDKAVNPTNVMGASKRIAEIYVQSFFYHLKRKSLLLNNSAYTRFITTRFGNVLGSNGSVIPRFRLQIEHGGPVTVTHPDITRFFMTIPEACRLVLEAGAMGKGGEIYVFDMGESVKIVDLARKMIRLSGFVPDEEIAIEFSGLRPGEKLYEELLNDSENTIPTHHSKVLIAKVREYNFEYIGKLIELLIEEAVNQNNLQVVQRMKQIVPEFISRNSVYEELDEAPSIAKSV